MNNRTFVILGTGIAGFSAAERIRQLDPDCAITMIGKEPELPYLRPLLSKTWFSSFRSKAARLASPEWFSDQRITLRLDCEISQLRPDRKELTLTTGETICYDSLIYALGAQSFIPPIAGSNLPHVFPLRTIFDFNHIRLSLATARNAVVIGGGVVGLEIAGELSRMEIGVTILEAAPRIMGRLLDAEAASLLMKHFQEKGIACHTGVTIDQITEKEVVLSDGRSFAADLVILSCGIRANTEVASDAGIKCQKGVLVDATLRTNIPDIYAAGDCIELTPLKNPGLWNYSRLSGEIAGSNAVAAMRGEKACLFRAEAEPVIVNCAGLSVYVIGDTSAEDCCSAGKEMRQPAFLINRRGSTDYHYKKLFYRDGCLCGAILMGDLSELTTISRQILTKEV